MTRKEIEDSYTVEDGVIKSLGQFEGEAVYVPYFWGQYLDGCADELDNGELRFEVLDEDRAMFPELGDAKRVRLYQTDTGFVVEV